MGQPSSNALTYSVQYPLDQIEVIVMDGGSTDATTCFVKESPAKLLLGGKTPAEARNIGIRHAEGTIIAFTDADCRVKEDWISILSSHLNNPLVAGVGGPNITIDEDVSYLVRYIGVFMESFLGSAGTKNTARYEHLREVCHNPTVNSAVRKCVLEEVRRFDPNLTVSEDVDLDARIRRRGYRLLYDPRMIVWHHRRNTVT